MEITERLVKQAIKELKTGKTNKAVRTRYGLSAAQIFAIDKYMDSVGIATLVRKLPLIQENDRSWNIRDKILERKSP